MSYCRICGKPKVVADSGRFSEVTGDPEYEERCEHPCHIQRHEVHSWKVTGWFSQTLVCKRCGVEERQ